MTSTTCGMRGHGDKYQRGFIAIISLLSFLIILGSQKNRRDSTESPQTFHSVSPNVNILQSCGTVTTTNTLTLTQLDIRLCSDCILFSSNVLCLFQGPTSHAQPHCFISAQSLKKLWHMYDLIELSGENRTFILLPSG